MLTYGENTRVLNLLFTADIFQCCISFNPVFTLGVSRPQCFPKLLICLRHFFIAVSCHRSHPFNSFTFAILPILYKYTYCDCTCIVTNLSAFFLTEISAVSLEFMCRQPAALCFAISLAPSYSSNAHS